MLITYSPRLLMFFFINLRTSNQLICFSEYPQLIPLLLLSSFPSQVLFILIHLIFFALLRPALNFLFGCFIGILRILLFIQLFIFLILHIHPIQVPPSNLLSHSFMILNDLMFLICFLSSDSAFFIFN